MQLPILPRNCRDEGFERNRDGVPLILFPCFRHFPLFAQPLSRYAGSLFSGSSFFRQLLWSSGKPTAGNSKVRSPSNPTAGGSKETVLTTRYLNNTFLLPKSGEKKEGTLKSPSSLFLPML